MGVALWGQNSVSPVDLMKYNRVGLITMTHEEGTNSAYHISIKLNFFFEDSKESRDKRGEHNFNAEATCTILVPSNSRRTLQFYFATPFSPQVILDFIGYRIVRAV